MVGGTAAILYADEGEPFLGRGRNGAHGRGDAAHQGVPDRAPQPDPGLSGPRRLADQLGADQAAHVLAQIDQYYAEQHGEGEGIASQPVRQLADPHPADAFVIDQLSTYRRPRKRWSDWSAVTEVLQDVAARMVEP